MKLDSVLALKRAMARAARTNTARGFGIAGEAAAGKRIGLAFGAAPMWGRRQYKLAVRVIGGRAHEAAAMMPDLSAVPEDELDLVDGLRYTPRLTLRAGGSCGHFAITAGTLGAFVEDDSHYYVLSNNHVLANSDDARKGDEIWQPGPDDVVGGKHKVIAHLERFARLRKTRRDNVDAAVARLSDEVSDFYPWSYTGIGEIDPRPVEDRFRVDRVVKRGRTTGLTRGRVSAFDLDGVEIDYGTARKPKLITFDNLLEVIDRRPKQRDFSAGGDSGSLIIDDATRRPYALLLGGGPDAQGIDRTIAHFLPTVLERLAVRMVR